MPLASSSRKRNHAFAGDHITPSCARGFRVYYLGAKELAAIHGAMLLQGKHVPPRGHHARIQTGWYWIEAKHATETNSDKRTGPYTSSRGAYQAAIQKLDNGKG